MLSKSPKNFSTIKWRPKLTVLDVVQETLCCSKGHAKRLISQGAVRILGGPYADYIGKLCEKHDKK